MSSKLEKKLMRCQIGLKIDELLCATHGLPPIKGLSSAMISLRLKLSQPQGSDQLVDTF
jgi:hypothetical protein